MDWIFLVGLKNTGEINSCQEYYKETLQLKEG